MGSYTPIKHTIGIVKELILFTQKNSISFYSFILIAQDKDVSFRITLLYLVSLHSNVFSQTIPFIYYEDKKKRAYVRSSLSINRIIFYFLDHERNEFLPPSVPS